MQSKILGRIVAASGMPRLFPFLAEEVPPSDLQSLLLSVYQERARSIREPGVLARNANAPLFKPSDVHARIRNRATRRTYPLLLESVPRAEYRGIQPHEAFGRNIRPFHC